LRYLPRRTGAASGPSDFDCLYAACDGTEHSRGQATGTCVQADLGHGEWGLDDGSGDLVVDDQLMADGWEVAPAYNTRYRVLGIGTFSYGAFKLEALEVPPHPRLHTRACPQSHSPSLEGGSPHALFILRQLLQHTEDIRL
jgi:hypothetical protein